MSVVSAAAKFSKQTVANSEERAYSTTYIVIVTDKQDGPVIVRNALPGPGSTYSFGNSFDADAFFVGYGMIHQPEWVKDRLTWAATVNYSSRGRDKCFENQTNGPLDEPPRIWGGGLRLRRTAHWDKDNNAILNVNGDQLDPVDLQVDSSDDMLNVQINLPFIDIGAMRELTDAVNSAPFFGLGAREWKAEPPQWEQLYYGNCDVYYRVQFAFRGNTDGWDLQPANKGKVDNAGASKPDARGLPKPGFWPLDAAGAFVAAGGGVVFFDGIAPNMQPKRYYDEIDYGSFGIPTDL